MLMSSTTQIGKYSPYGDSPYGVVDMTGNVWEWCADWYYANEYKRRVTSGGHIKDPIGPATGDQRVLRGGGFGTRTNARAAYRHHVRPDNSVTKLDGFRVVMSKPSV
jgi:formylglycine-generating enzyme required for sulfatase activity